MRDDVLKVIQGHHEITNVIILTHNIDFVFAESVVLRTLRRCGNPRLTIFADFWCADQSFANQSRVLDRMGTRYRVVPVAAESGYRFHPKAILLSGSKQGTLLVGSGNLTYGGWRENFEVWVQYESGVDGVGPFVAFREYVLKLLGLVRLNQPIIDELDETFDVTTHPWLAGKGDTAGLLGRVPEQAPLFEQMSSRITPAPVDVLTVCSPYYDRHAKALNELTRVWNAPKVRVLCQPGRSGLRRSAAARIRKGRIDLVPIEPRESDDEGASRTRFVHAKFYAFERGNQVTVVSGSANCSHAALNASGKLGNAELMAAYSLSRQDFREGFLDEFSFLTGEVQLSDQMDDPEELTREQPPLMLLAAQFEAGTLLFAYTSLRNVRITDYLGDAEARPVRVLGEGYAKAAIEKPPRTVVLRGKLGGQDICSNRVWVHDERELRSTSSARTLADVIRGNVRADSWGLPAYAEVLRALHRHLEYVPRRSSSAGLMGPAGSPSQVEFSESDVFSGEFNPPRTGSYFVVGDSGEEPVASLRNLLARWFGFHSEEDDSKAPADVDGSLESPTLEEESVDRPAPLPSVGAPEKREKEDEAGRRVAQKLVGRIAEAMTSPFYLQERHPEFLAIDLKVTAALLRVGLKEEWITKEEFFGCTHRIWTRLFFTSDVSPTEGWLQYRWRTNPSPRTLAASMQSNELSAALAAWALAIPDEISTPEEARFALSCVLSAARLPWLWLGGPTKAIANELASVLRHTASKQTTNNKKYWKEVERRWLKMLRRGYALGRLEASLKGRTPGDLKSAIFQDHISTGELLWQGASGFCVADYSCRRSFKQKVSVRPLQGIEEKSFQSDYLIPIRALLDPRVIPFRRRFGKEEREEIATFVAQLRKRLRHYEFEDEEDDDTE